MIVVDSNIICYRWMASDHSELADAAWNKDADWIVPLLWRSEFRNALAGALRQKLISLEAMLEIAEGAEAQMNGHEFLVSSSVVLRLVARSRCSAYDCEFVALAQEQKVPLITADRQLLREFAKTAIALSDFVRN